MGGFRVPLLRELCASLVDFKDLASNETDAVTEPQWGRVHGIERGRQSRFRLQASRPAKERKAPCAKYLHWSALRVGSRYSSRAA